MDTCPSPGPTEAGESLCSWLTGGWKLVVTKPFHFRIPETSLSSCSCDPDSCPQVLSLLSLNDGSTFFLILGASQYSSTNFFFFLKRLQSWFLYLFTETLIDIGKLSYPVFHSESVGSTNMPPDSQGPELNKHSSTSFLKNKQKTL